MRPTALVPLAKRWSGDKYYQMKKYVVFMEVFVDMLEHLFNKMYINATALKYSSEKFRNF
jgi:hypothetical protein